jgi:hypothetical protein
MGNIRAFAAPCLLLLVLTPGKAHADSFALGTVSIDWTALAFSGISIAFDQDTFFSGAGAFAGDVTNFNGATADAWSDLFVSALVAPGTLPIATASTSDTEISASIVSGGNALSNSGFANREVNFTALETGTLTVSAPFTMFTQLDVQHPNGSAGTLVDATLWLFSPSRLVFDDELFFPFVGGVGSSTDLISGTLTTSLFFEAAQEGRFLATASASGFTTVPVPEPSSLILLGWGLAVVVLRKKYQDIGDVSDGQPRPPN